MHILTIESAEQTIDHAIAAVKHWLNKIEQEVMNVDGGPSDDGAYSFEHEGKPTTVTWSASAAAVSPLPATPDHDVDADELASAQAELAAAGEKHPTDTTGVDMSKADPVAGDASDNVTEAPAVQVSATAPGAPAVIETPAEPTAPAHA
jgi:hypothetical protein